MKITRIIGGTCSLLVALLLADYTQSFARHVVLPALDQSPAYIMISGHKLVASQVFTLTLGFTVASVGLIFAGLFLLIRRRGAA